MLELDFIIKKALEEDLREGDHTTLSIIPPETRGSAKLLIKDTGILAGVEVAKRVFEIFDPELQTDVFITDGTHVHPGDIAFEVKGSARSILQTERLVLNFMQRMSGIATQTAQYVKAIEGTKTKILDTRKTTPCLRLLEKAAVKIGGGHNHRFGLYDMILIKDNHIDFAGGIEQAIDRVHAYLKDKGLNLKIEIEVRNFDELEQVIKKGGVHRIMLDNFTPEQTQKAVKLIDGRYEIESSGGITLENVREYALAGVDYISVGALTHQIKSLDMSLKKKI